MNSLGTHVHHPSLSACNHPSALLCKRRNSSHTDQQSPWGSLLEVMKQPKSWEGLRGQRELALIPALPPRRDLFISPSTARAPRNQYSPSNKRTHPPLPQLACTVQCEGTCSHCSLFHSSATLAAKCSHIGKNVIL